RRLLIRAADTCRYSAAPGRGLSIRSTRHLTAAPQVALALLHTAVRANRVRGHPPFLHGGIGELLPSALRPAHRTPEGREPVFVALAGLRPTLQQDGHDLRTADERCPPEGNRVVLPIQKRHVRTEFQQ